MSSYELPKVEVEIKGVRYRLTALPNDTGEKVLPRLIRTYGPVFAAAAREQIAVSERHLSDGTTPEQLKILANAFATAASMEAFCRALQDDDVTYLSRLFKAQTEIWGGEDFVPMSKRPDLEGGSFVQNYGLLFMLLKEHLDLNYSSFLKDVTGQLRA